MTKKEKELLAKVSLWMLKNGYDKIEHLDPAITFTSKMMKRYELDLQGMFLTAIIFYQSHVTIHEQYAQEIADLLDEIETLEEMLDDEIDTSDTQYIIDDIDVDDITFH